MMNGANSMRAVVTGASRGVGRGVAEALGEAGATVYLTGRDEKALDETVARVKALGGLGVGIRCDHREDRATEAAFERVRLELGGIDVLVNSAWGGYERMVENGEYTWEAPFWKQPTWRWDAMFAGGVRAAYASSRLAARMMVEQRKGLIVNLSYWAARKYMANVAYGVAKTATDRMTADMAHELRQFGVVVVSLYPGLVRTEKVMEAAEHLDLGNSESPRFVGRAVVALANDRELEQRSGAVLVAADVCHEYGIADVDGSRPRPLTLEEA
jgi:NAD(P)-dependent dehydrogenase (short-subunit alcohol dehydrogenase family)